MDARTAIREAVRTHCGDLVSKAVAIVGPAFFKPQGEEPTPEAAQEKEAREAFLADLAHRCAVPRISKRYSRLHCRTLWHCESAGIPFSFAGDTPQVAYQEWKKHKAEQAKDKGC